MLCLFKGPIRDNSWKLAMAINSTCSTSVSCSVMELYSIASSQLKNRKLNSICTVWFLLF